MICHSGGALGSDTIFQKMCKKYNIQCNAYYYKIKTPNGNFPISDSDFEEGLIYAKQAAKILGRKWSKKYYTQYLLSRNWYQVKNSNIIFAICELEPNKKFVKGGTGYTIEMAKLTHKQIYIFEQSLGVWMQYLYFTENASDGYFKQIEFTLSLNSIESFAGIGTRKINENGINAIQKLFLNSFN